MKTFAKLGLFVLVSVSAAGDFVQASPSMVCADAFSSATNPLTVKNESFEYLKQISGNSEFKDVDLAQMSKLSQLFGEKASSLYTRAQEILKIADSELALTVNNQEIIRAAALSLLSKAGGSVDPLRTNLGTFIVMLKPVGAGGHRLAVPNRVQMRLATLSLLTGESPGDVAYRFNENFKTAMSQPPQSATDMIFAKSPIDIALALTIADSSIANSNAAMVLAE